MSSIGWYVLIAIIPLYLLLVIRSGGSFDPKGIIKNLMLGLICLIIAGHDLVTGEVTLRYSGTVVHRSSDPEIFWSSVIAFGGFGLFCLFRFMFGAVTQQRN